MKGLPVLAGCLVLGVAIMTFAMWYTDDPESDTFIPHPAGAMLAVTFAHADHTEQNCIICHHNYVDDTGQGLCFDCHKTDPQVSDLIEEQFHDLCRTCHMDHQREGEDYGPIRQCYACHLPDDRP